MNLIANVSVLVNVIQQNAATAVNVTANVPKKQQKRFKLPRDLNMCASVLVHVDYSSISILFFVFLFSYQTKYNLV